MQETKFRWPKNIDWTKTDSEIAQETGKSVYRVSIRRRNERPSRDVEILIMESMRREMTVLQRLDELTHWGLCLPAVNKLTCSATGYVQHRKKAWDKKRRTVMKGKKQIDPDYKEKMRLAINRRQRDREYSAHQKDRRRSLARDRYQTRDKHDPRWKMKHNMRVRLRKFLGGMKSASMLKLLQCSADDLVRHLENQFKRGMTWKNYGVVWHVDHIIPCASFDLTTHEGQAECFHFSNLRPLWAKENLSKGARIIQHQPELLLPLT